MDEGTSDGPLVVSLAFAKSYREWAPGAKALHLIGDFNGWNRESHPCQMDQYGVWSTFLPNKADGSPALEDGSSIKVGVAVEKECRG